MNVTVAIIGSSVFTREEPFVSFLGSPQSKAVANIERSDWLLISIFIFAIMALARRITVCSYALPIKKPRYVDGAWKTGRVGYVLSK